MFDLFEILFPLMFFLIFGMFVVILVRNLMQWNKNNHAPCLTVEAKIVAKRSHANHSAGQNGMGSTFYTYYVTFEVDSGDRMELSMSGTEYGMLAEGDKGKLTFQGTRYLKFERI